MVRAFTERLIVLSTVAMLVSACLPDTSLGRFARGATELICLALLIAPIASAIAGA